MLAEPEKRLTDALNRLKSVVQAELSSKIEARLAAQSVHDSHSLISSLRKYFSDRFSRVR